MSWLSGLLSAEIFISTEPRTTENSHFLRLGSQEAALVMKGTCKQCDITIGCCALAMVFCEQRETSQYPRRHVRWEETTKLSWIWTHANNQKLKYFELRPSSSMNGSVRLSVRPSVTPFWLCSHHPIIIKFSGIITNDKSDVHAKGQSQRSKVKVTEVMTPFSRFRTVTPVSIHRLRWNDPYSLMLLRRGTLLFFKVIC